MRLTKKAAIEMVNEIITEVGADHEVSGGGCVYFVEAEKKKSTPSCLVGHVFYKAGIRYSDLMGENGSSFPWSGDLMARLESAGLTFTSAATVYLSTLQDYQDHGMAWGKCQSKALSKK